MRLLEPRRSTISFIKALRVLYGPILIALIMFAIIVGIKKDVESEAVFHFFGLFDLPFTVKMTMVIKILLAVATFLIPFFIYLGRDFSVVFPQELKMNVFFDSAGIDKRIDDFSDREKENIGISPTYQDSQGTYYDDLDNTLINHLNYKEGIFHYPEDIHSEGKTSFIVEQANGLHRYYIAEANGELEHTLEKPNSQPQGFISKFERIESAHNFVKLNLRNYLTSGAIILQPRFKQFLQTGPDSQSVLFDHKLVGLTRVKVYPLPKIGDTIYFYEKPDTSLVPIAYAIYK